MCTTKLLNKIRDNFTEDQQHMFLASFYCYLNYDAKKDFIVSLDNIWKWTGFSRKDHAKTMLEKYFIINVDYIFQISAPATAGANIINEPLPPTGGAKKNGVEKRGGSNKDTILLTVNAFKKFCLKANTKRADEIHDYYIKLEELLQQTVMEENDEIRKQLVEQDKKICQLSRYVVRKFNTKFRQGNCVYFIRSPDIDNRFKIGSTGNVNLRLQDLSTGSPLPMQVIELFYTEFHTLLEKSIKELFSKHRVSVNCEWYETSNLEEIKKFILQQIDLYNEFKMHSNVETGRELRPPTVDADADADALSQTMSDTPKDDKVPIYGNEKICKHCHQLLNHKYFFCLDKTKRQYYDECISCYEKEHDGEHKQCTKCLLVKDKNTSFVVDKTKKDGYTYECKHCRNEFQNTRIQNNKEQHASIEKIKCTVCNESKTIKMFYSHKKDSEYLPQCKECFCKNNGPHKQCFTCKEIKQTELFDKKSASNDGFESNCKDCRKIVRDKIRSELREQNKNVNKKQCAQCHEYLKFNMFFKNADKTLYDQCMTCYTPASLQCNKCLEVKTTTESFSRDSTKRTGYRTICKICT